MAATTLVDADVEMGRELVQVFDESGFPVTGAAWIYFPDLEDWCLVIRTPEAAKNLQEAYLKMAVAMDEKGNLRQRLNLARIKLVPPSDRMLQAIGTVVQAAGPDPLRLSPNVVDGIYIDEALIYRLAA